MYSTRTSLISFLRLFTSIINSDFEAATGGGSERCYCQHSKEDWETGKLWLQFTILAFISITGTRNRRLQRHLPTSTRSSLKLLISLFSISDMFNLLFSYFRVCRTWFLFPHLLALHKKDLPPLGTRNLEVIKRRTKERNQTEKNPPRRAKQLVRCATPLSDVFYLTTLPFFNQQSVFLTVYCSVNETNRNRVML